MPRKMRPSSSASIACIASPRSGFYRFYQYQRRKFRILANRAAIQKTRQESPGLMRQAGSKTIAGDGDGGVCGDDEPEPERPTQPERKMLPKQELRRVPS